MIVTQFVDRCSSHPFRPQLHSTSSFNYAGIHSPVICVLLPVVVHLLLLLHNHLWWWTVCWALLSVCPKQIVVVSHGGPLHWAPTLLPGMIILIRLHLGTRDGGQYNKNDMMMSFSPPNSMMMMITACPPVYWNGSNIPLEYIFYFLYVPCLWLLIRSISTYSKSQARGGLKKANSKRHTTRGPASVVVVGPKGGWTCI